MEKTVFTRIIEGEIPATILYQDEQVIAINDVAPQAPTHVLLITKKPIVSLDALTDEDRALVGHVFTVARDLARELGIASSGYRVVTNCGTNGGQTVPHLHFHLLGGAPLGRMNTTDLQHTSPSRSGMLFDAGIIVAVAIGLAVVFNTLNPKLIPWIKTEFERVQASSADVEKYLANPHPNTTTSSQPEVVQPTATPAPTPTSKTPVPTTEAPTPSQPAAQNNPQPPTEMLKAGEVKEITHDMFVRLMAATDYYLIDARSPEKYAEGRIGNATNFPGMEAQQRIREMLEKVPRGKIILIYCDGGECELSHHVADVLKQFQYGPIFIYTGGWAEWTQKH